MKDNIAIELLLKILSVKDSVDIYVKGHSMCPTLYEGDKITICKSDNYNVGDILVFAYKFDMLLTHRLVKFDSRYLCKGDNAFRLEDVELHNIIGKIIKVNDKDVQPWPLWKINMSYEVNRIFFNNRYDINKTKQTDLYKVYEQLVLKRFGMNLKFRIGKLSSHDMYDASYTCLNKMTKSQRSILEIIYVDILVALSTECSIKEIMSVVEPNANISTTLMQESVEAFIAVAFMENIVVLSE